MEIEGTVISILPQVKGVSARGEWIKQEVILEQSGEFNRKACISFWGDRALDAAALKPGERINVAVNVESREHNGRWYTELRAWKLARPEAVAGVQAVPVDEAPWPTANEDPGQPTSAQDAFDDLPSDIVKTSHL